MKQPPSTAADPSAFTALLERLAQRYGLALSEHMRQEYERKLHEVMARFSQPDPFAFEALLSRDATVQDELISELTIGETFFFRDWSQFEALRETILPERLALSGAQSPVRVWSAACASGEEPYSIAILAESMGVSASVKIAGTDIAGRALAKARRGIYGLWSLRGERPDLARRYLRPEGDSLVLSDSIRRLVTFDVLNLADEQWQSANIHEGSIDILLCRNVFIYFDGGTVRKVASRLHGCLAPGGWLLTAATDPPLWNHAPFDTHFSSAGVMYRRAEGNRTTVVEAPSAFPMHVSETHTRVRQRAVEPIRSPLAVLPEWRLSSAGEPLRAARKALQEGDAKNAYQATLGHEADEACACIQLRALSGYNEDSALRLAPELVRRHPYSPELRFLHALVLMLAGQSTQAVRALEEALYLDRSLAVVHLLHGTLLRQRGNEGAARRAFERALNLSSASPSERVAPFGEGDTHAHTASGARLALSQSYAQGPVPRLQDVRRNPA